MKNYLSLVINVVLVVVLIDFIGFAMWVGSNQQPLDGFYLGTITSHILKIVL